MIRTFVLVQHYAAAMMAVHGLSQMKNHTSVETLEITQNLINSPKQCPCGHGLMVLLRVPCSPLAAVAYERLAHVRARLALEERFEIILGSASSGITVGKHFVRQLKVGARVRDMRGGRRLGLQVGVTKGMRDVEGHQPLDAAIHCGTFTPATPLAASLAVALHPSV